MNRWIGLGAVVLSLAVVFIWIPLDVESGLIEKVRRSITLGDAFAPTVAGGLVGLGGLLCLLAGDVKRSSDNAAQLHSALSQYRSIEHLRHALMMCVIFVVGLTLMRFTGPVAVSLFHEQQTEYRLLRDTVPWKYIGFILGGTTLIASLIAWTEKRLRIVHVAIGVAATLALIAVYDLPFDDLLLPPNGDV